jgi:hypothetical protein
MGMKQIIAVATLTLSLLGTACVTRVALRAPGPRVEVIGVSPYRGAVWIPGRWVRARYDWVWVRGYWR